MRRIHVSVRSQVMAVGALALVGLSGVAGAASAFINAPGVTSSLANYAARTSEVVAMEDRVDALNAEVVAIRKDAENRAAMLAKRQAVLAGMLAGNADPAKVASLLSFDGRPMVVSSKDVLVAFSGVDADQVKMARELKAINDARYAEAVGHMQKLGIDPARYEGGMGGPYEPVTTEIKQDKPAETATVGQQADPQFRALFNSWKRVDTIEDAIGGIPSAKPVMTSSSINSGFGVRSDPFRGTPAMHAGIDIPGPIGTPIYATADGIVGRAGRVGGYGNLIEIEHGRGVQTRFGHLSQILVAPGTRVKRGQLIGRMGSTGRSTGSHLHYEVRIDGRAVNPIPFLQSGDYLLALQNRVNVPQAPTALGGPAKAE